MHGARATAVAMLLLALAGGAQAGTGGSISGRIVANPLDVRLTLATSQTQVGTRFAAGATVRNIGARSLANVTLALRADPAVVVTPSAPWALGTLAGGATTAGAWILCGSSPGNYVIVARATGGGFTGDSSARVVSVAAGRGRCR
jgi:hypothetical protein